jgi:tellurite resistance protein
MSVRGLGSASAANIAAVASSVIAQSWNLAVPYPTEPFSMEKERTVVQAIYRMRWFRDEMAEKLTKQQQKAELYTKRSSLVLKKTAFARWIVVPLNGSPLQVGLAEAESICGELEDKPTGGEHAEVSSCIERLTSISKKAIDVQTIVGDFRVNRAFYEQTMTEILGKPGKPEPVAARPNVAEPVSVSMTISPAAPPRPIPAPPGGSVQFTFTTSTSGSAFEGSHLWVPTGKDVKVHGYTIPNGMVYLGHITSRKQGTCIDPSLIDPTLPVSDNGDCHVDLMGYWPSYSAVSPQARGAYLHWLSTGKGDPQADIGYVFLYFYGLERRLFSLPSLDSKTTPEVDLIRKEIARLADIYADLSGSFAGYSSSLLDYLEAKKGPFPTLDSLSAPPEPRRGHNLSLELRIGLGIQALAQKPLPVEWAYCWYVSSTPTAFDMTKETNGHLLQSLFNQVYQDTVEDGVVLTPTFAYIEVSHHFGNATLAGTNATQRVPLPDVIADTGARDTVGKVGDTTAALFRKYSSFCKEFPDQDTSIAGLSLLPPATWPAETLNAYKTIRPDAPTVLRFSDLPGFPSPGFKLNRSRLIAFTERLAVLGLGMEPDPRSAGGIPSPDDLVAIFGITDIETSDATSAHFNGAALLLQLASVVAAASEDFCDAEASLILNHLHSETNLPAHEKQRLEARLAIYRRQSPSTSGLKKRIAAIDSEAREAIGNFLVQVALADGNVDPSEVRALETLFRLLGLERNVLYSKIHKAETQGSSMTVNQHESVYKPAVAAAVEQGIRFDSARIAALRSESAKISKILDQVFDSSGDHNSKAVEDEPFEGREEPLLGLDPDHAELLQAFLTRPQWARSEAEQLCTEHGLMIDGALERINDAAFDRLDCAALEGDDLIEVNCELFAKENA